MAGRYNKAYVVKMAKLIQASAVARYNKLNRSTTMEHKLNLLDILPDAKGKIRMREYVVSLRDDQTWPGFNTYGGVNIAWTCWDDHHVDYCYEHNIYSVEIQLRKKKLRDVIKLYIKTGGYAGLTLNQYVDSMLGAGFRREYAPTALVVRSIYRGWRTTTKRTVLKIKK